MSEAPLRTLRSPYRQIRIVAIGASAGGPNALNVVFCSLPKDLPVPILCVQHMGAGFLRDFIDWLSLDCALKIKIAERGELPTPGTIYFPEEGSHLTLDSLGRLAHSLDEPFHGHRPSVTVTFKAVAASFGDSAVGILLTGMGTDGADGLKALSEAGALTIAQDEQTSVVFGMPGSAIAMGAAQWVLPLHRIAEALVSQIGAIGARS